MDFAQVKSWTIPEGAVKRAWIGGQLVWQAPVSARSYVQDGLVAMWDGIENAGWGVHDANATVWEDLAGGLNLVLNGSSRFNDYSYSPNGSSYASKAGSQIPSVNHVELCFMRKDGEEHNTILTFGTGSNTGCSSLFYSGTRLNVFSNVKGYNTNYNNLKISVSCSKSAAASEIFVDGQKLAPNGNVDSSNADANFVSIGVRKFNNSYSRYFRGEIYCIRVYSRALTADEIAHNYAIDKERFDLP